MSEEGDKHFPVADDPAVLSSLLETPLLGYVVWDQLGTILGCNPLAAELLSLGDPATSGQPARQPLSGLVNEAGESYRIADLPMFVALREWCPVIDVVIGIDMPDLPRRWIRTSTAPIVLDDGTKAAATSLIDATSEIERRKMLELLAEVNLLLTRSTDEGFLLQGLCDLLVEKGGYPLAWIGVEENAGGSLEIRWVAGKADYLYEGIVSALEDSPKGRGPTGSAFRERVMHVANNIHIEPQYEVWRDRAIQFELFSSIALPLDVSVPAVLTVYSHHTFGFDDTLAMGISEVAHGVERAASLLRSYAETEHALDGTMRALAAMTEVRDAYTHGHQERVGWLAEAIAQRLGLEPSLVKQIRLGGTVHDIGKITVPADILNRPRALAAIEFELVQTHCRVGADILASASLDAALIDIALHHHERLDGSGYPDGLVGGEISIGARIVGVADVVEAMMHHRPYRAALGLAKAFEVITSQRGTKFDAQVVDACIAVFDDGFTLNREGGGH